MDTPFSHLNLFKQLLTLRKDPVFRYGHFSTSLVSETMYSFFRTLDSEVFLVIIDARLIGDQEMVYDFSSKSLAEEAEIVVFSHSLHSRGSPIAQPGGRVSLNRIALQPSEACVVKVVSLSQSWLCCTWCFWSDRTLVELSWVVSLGDMVHFLVVYRVCSSCQFPFLSRRPGWQKFIARELHNFQMVIWLCMQNVIWFSCDEGFFLFDKSGSFVSPTLILFFWLDALVVLCVANVVTEHLSISFVSANDTVRFKEILLYHFNVRYHSAV